MGITEKTFTVNGLTVRHYEQGDPAARTLLLLHGGFGDARLNWEGVMDSLSDEYHLIAPDLPGFGRSDALPEPGIDSLIDWLRTLLDELGLEQVGIVAHAFGALLARLFAAQHPGYVPALIMADGGVASGAAPAAKAIAGVPLVGKMVFNRLARSTSARSSLEKAVHNKSILTDAFVENVQSNADGLTAVMTMLTKSALPEKRTPPVSVLMMWGEEDQITPIEAGQSAYRNIPGAQFIPISECGHLPHLEVPDVFVWQIRNFLDELVRSRKGATE